LSARADKNCAVSKV